MTKQRQRDRKKRNFKVIPSRKHIQEIVQKEALKLRSEGYFPYTGFYNPRTKRCEFQVQAKAKCKAIKMQRDKQITAIFYDHLKDVDFVGTFYQRDDETFETFTMEMSKMGKYSETPKIQAGSLSAFIWEFEHWLTGLFEYLDENKIECEWGALDLAWRHWQDMPDEKKVSFTTDVSTTVDNQMQPNQLTQLYEQGVNSEYHKKLKSKR